MKQSMPAFVGDRVPAAHRLRGPRGRESICRVSERVNAAQSLTFTANVRAEYEHKTAKFTLSYTEDDSGGAVTVLAPGAYRGRDRTC